MPMSFRTSPQGADEIGNPENYYQEAYFWIPARAPLCGTWPG